MNFVNASQTPQERAGKYRFVKRAGLPAPLAHQMRDWTWNHIQLMVKTSTGKKPRKPNKKGERIYLPF
jgi:hypothetical protein